MTPTLQDFKAELFRTLANPLRIRILEALREAGSLNVGEIQQRVGAEPSNVSQHLGIMRGRGLLVARREGTTVWYAVADAQVFGLLDAARSMFEAQLAARRQVLDDEDGQS